jgi:mono/diheme cytochrome c family protein
MTKTMTSTLTLAAMAALLAAGPALADGKQKQIALGRKLVTLGGCNDCHTPLKMGENGPQPDLSRLLSGHPEQVVMPPAPKLPEGPWMATVGATMTAWSGPWGVSYTANLTPDPETGLGRWTEKQFVDTLRTGRHQGRGRQLLPPMVTPAAFSEHTDAELGAIFAYLRSIPAVHNRVPEPQAPLAMR